MGNKKTGGEPHSLPDREEGRFSAPGAADRA